MAQAGGGFTYLVNLMPRLLKAHPEDRFRLILRTDRLAASLPQAPNLELDILPASGWLARLWFTTLAAPRLADAWHADLYFSTGEYAPWRARCPMIASFRNPNVFTSLDQGWPLRQQLRLAVLRSLARVSARACDRILFMSRDAASWIGDALDLPEEKRIIIPHGIDAAVWSPQNAGSTPPIVGPYVLSVSTIYRYKNFVRLIQAWSILAHRLPDVPDLVIIGDDQDPPYRRKMEDARRAAGPLAERIHLIGEVPYEEIRAWYAGASLFVFPSYLETFGHPLVEAMAMGVPVVASEISVFREIARDAISYADAQDPQDLARAMEAVLTDSELRAELTRRGRERVAGYDWDRAATQLSELFDQVIAEARERFERVGIATAAPGSTAAEEERPAVALSPDDSRLPIGVLTIARDEEANLPDCLHSVVGWASKVVVVLDPRSTDRSREVAEGTGAEVVEHLFETYARQRNWALDHVNWEVPWILILDADERVSPNLVDELRAIVRSASSASGYAVKRRFIFYGKWMKHCWYFSWDLRFFRRGKARYEERRVHENVIVDGSVGFLRGDIIHNDFKDMDSWITKHNRYATFEAEEIVEGEKGGKFRGALFGTPLERRRYLKEGIWNRMPFRPLWLFVYLYFIKLGILDGRLGFRFCMMHAIFDGFLTAKVWEKRLPQQGGIPNYYRRELAAFLAEQPALAGRYETGRSAPGEEPNRGRLSSASAGSAGATTLAARRP
ncbi:MAG TPA: glycosyltransferase [Myxococcota bacterium]|nr:glycosyltransferase [Myxococcota bacterium]